MAIFLTDGQVVQFLDIQKALRAIEEIAHLHCHGKAFNYPRQRVRCRGEILHFMSACVPAWEMIGFKAYTSQSVLFSLYGDRGKLLMVAQANHLGQIRTGAASGIATKFMAPKEAKTIGIIGTGFQAEAQLEAICRVKHIENIKAYSRTRERRQKFSQKMTERLNIPVQPVESAEEAIVDVNIVVTATTSKEPVLHGAWLKKGMHINAIGSNMLVRRELDSEAVRKCDLIVVDDRLQAQMECGDLLMSVERGDISWDRLPELSEVVAGKVKGRHTEDDITLFESQGIALWDLAVGKIIYESAIAEGFGAQLLF